MLGFLLDLLQAHLRIDFVDALKHHVAVQRIAQVTAVGHFLDGALFVTHQFADSDTHIATVQCIEIGRVVLKDIQRLAIVTIKGGLDHSH